LIRRRLTAIPAAKSSLAARTLLQTADTGERIRAATVCPARRPRPVQLGADADGRRAERRRCVAHHILSKIGLSMRSKARTTIFTVRAEVRDAKGECLWDVAR
jgi:hypothetical protein